jgi:hypothetical protein
MNDEPLFSLKWQPTASAARTASVEAEIFKNAGLLGYRHQTRVLAVQWAERQRQDIEKGGE